MKCGSGWRQSMQKFVLGLLLSLAAPFTVHAQADAEWRSWNQPVRPFRIIGNIYYVGASDVTSFLIVTPAGDILLDGGFAETAPQIEANIVKLAFKLTDVKFLLNSHAHFDHAGGLAKLKKRTGAQFVAMQGDAQLLAGGGHGDFYFGSRLTFPPVHPDRIIHDRYTLTLGGVTLTAHLTAGHTRGCTTWTMDTQDSGRTLHVVFIGSMSVLPGYRLSDKESYPGIGSDYAKSFRLLQSLPCDVFLASHGSFFDLNGKRAALAKGPRENPFIDPAGYQAYVERAERAYNDELRREHASADPPSDSADGRSASGVMKVEQEWLDALNHRDASTLARILAPEWMENNWQGRVYTRQDILSYFSRPAAASQPMPAKSQKFDDTKVRFFETGNVAIATGLVVTESADATGKDVVHRSRFTDVFVWRDGRWQAVTAQETHLPDSTE